jgi:YD repeat-containing protein
VITVFFSYAHHDEALRNELEKHLAMLKRQGVIDTWHDRKIDAGQDVHEEISEYLGKADIILLLVSADFLASDYCYDIEMRRALERHQRGEARIIPIILRPCEWQRAPFGRLVAIPTDGKPITRFSNPDDAFLEVTQAIRKAAEKLHPRVRPTTPSPSPKTGRSVHLFSWAIVVLLILAGVGLRYWDAFYRQHIEYYANVSKRWGLPEGVGRLTDEQISHRNISLMFIKRGRVVQEIRAVNSQGAYPPAFAYFPSLSLVALNPLANVESGLESEVVTICRVTFKCDADGRILNQSAYNRSDRLLYTPHYAQPNIAEYKEGAFSKAVRESGITHIKFVRPDTGLEAGLDQELLFLDSTGKLKPDRGGTYGSRLTFNALGLPVEMANLGADGQPAVNSVGIAKTTFTYDGQGNLIQEGTLGPNGQPVLDSTGSAEIRMSYDQYGNVKEVAFFGTEGQLVTSKTLGAAGRTLAYNDHGNLIENTFFGPDRQLVEGALGVAKQTIVWDEKGSSLETYFGPDGKPILISGKAVKTRGVWDERGYLVEVAFFDENNRPIRDNDGCAKGSFTYDKHGNLTETACFDEGDQPVRNTDGDARVKRVYDERGNRVEESYFGPNGQPGRYEENFVKTRWKYNPQGKETETAYFDAADKPVRSKDGYAKVTYSYDLQGKVIEILFFDENGRPTQRKGGYARIVRAYDARGNMIEETVFNLQGKLTRGEDGCFKNKYAYDDRGYTIETACFDERSRPTLYMDGYAKVRSRYNDKGQLIELTLFGVDGSLIVHKKHGYAKVRRTYNARGKLSQIAFFDPNDRLVRHAYGYATSRVSYDDLGRETKREHLDANGTPVFTRVAIDKIEPDSKSQRIGLQVGDLILS